MIVVRKKHVIKIIAATFSLIALTSCSYVFTGSGTILPPDIKKVYIAPVQNNSTQFGLSETMTEAYKDQFDAYGVITVVDNQSEADAVLRSQIKQLTRRSRTASSGTNTSLQLETTMIVSAELARTDGPILWKDSQMSVSKTFGTDASVVVTSSADFASGGIGGADIANLDSRELARGQEQTVLLLLTQQVAQNVYDQAVAPDF